jgi:hypothetical protein
MSEQAPSPEEDTPAVAGPEGTPAPAAEDVDWQQRAMAAEDRYGHLQPEYTRATQEASALRERDQWYDLLLTSDDPDTRRQAAEALGYQLEDEQPQPDDPYKNVERRLGQVEETLTAAQQREADTEQAAYVRSVFDEKLDALGIAKEDQDWVLAYAINALPVTDDGWPDIDRAYAEHQAREDARQKAWAKSKRAPHISPNGQSATEVPNLDNRQERQEWMVRRLQENDQAQY